MASVRRLTAILAADVAGYSRLMGTDEEGTHERLKADLQELVNPKIAEHRGRIVKNTGDGFLAEFPSVVDAVRCAVEIQRGMAERNAETPEDKRIAFRIGVNLGDVIAEAGDIFGDGVNVAARLEALAEPGGICVSRVVRDQVRDRLDLGFEDLGEQQVKNLARPVRGYRVSDIGGGHQIPSVLAMPTLRVAPFCRDLSLGPDRICGEPSDPHLGWAFNLTGHPAISVNCGFSPEGLPIGLQLVGRFRDETSLLRTAALFEASSDLTGRWPPGL